MSTNFGSTTYADCFSNLPVPDVQALRQSTLEYLDNFDRQEWYKDPITTILQGNEFPITSTDSLVETKDAFGKPNGLQQLATQQQVDELIHAICSQKSNHKDLRQQLREIEQELLTTYAGSLIANQCLDFGKQDGITEMEESTMANAVERNLNDLLLDDEMQGKIIINRRPIYVSCVSNFTTFLDLFRKTIRSLELGIPCVILGRSNTSQHAYRWAQLLVTLMKQHEIEDMVTFLSCSVADIITITRSTHGSTGNLYTTCSRELAETIMEGYPNTIASTGGPNTLVTTEWTPSVQGAIRMSATIESAGQCTALRHCVVPSNVSKENIQQVFTKTAGITDPADAVKKGMFDGVYKNHEGTKGPDDEDYTYLTEDDVYIKINKGLPRRDIDEYWRKVVVDFSQLERDWERDEGEVYSLAMWLNGHQPISLAVNAKRDEALKLGQALFEKTGLVVYTIGSTDDEATPPALTCQARPQEAEIFGEFPPRDSMKSFTKFPVFVPSSTPSYDSTYTQSYLESVELGSSIPDWLNEMAMHIQDRAVRGYCFELLNYLYDATRTNPKRGFGTSRTALWGLQRPPILLGPKTLIRCPAGTSYDALAPTLLLFQATNARDQLEISVDSNDNEEIFHVSEKYGIPLLVQSTQEYNLRADSPNLVYNSVELDKPLTSFPMVGNFVSLFMSMGHIKSTKPNDDEFLVQFSKSEKWLQFWSELPPGLRP
jgi:hypothetical protein